MRIIITAALPYANGELHLGHLRSTYLPGDILARFYRLLGHEVYYLCATDEHGTPILFKAEEKGMKPEDYIEIWRKRHPTDLAGVLIRFTHFFATHTELHARITLDFYEKLKRFMEPRQVVEYWCSRENIPLPDRYVKGKCPFCGAEDQYGDVCEKCGRVIPPGALINPRCARCGAPAVLKKTEHLFFLLSRFQERLKEFLEAVKTTEDVKQYLRGWLEEGLKDWEIERSIEWGVKIPDREGVFYVWFDAPIGYISTLADYLSPLGKNWQEVWNSSKIIHIIGKDIIYHHFFFWPAMLVGYGAKLPDEIQVRGYLTLEGKKFSKSRGWYISIASWLNSGLDVEYLRFYLAYTTPLGMKDSDFSAREFRRVVNEELANNIGNLLHRVLKLLEKNGYVVEGGVNKEVYTKAVEAFRRWKHLMEEGHIDQALKVLTSLGHELNAYFQAEKPWENSAGEKAKETLRTVASALKLIFIGLYPVTPIKAREALGLLNQRLRVDEAPIPEGTKVLPPKIVFPKLTEEDERKLRGLYGKKG